MPIDYSRYPENWKTEIVPAVRKRSKDRCEFCGIKNKKYAYSLSLNIREQSTGRYKKKSLWLTSKDAVKRAELFGLGKIKKVQIVLTVAHLDHDEENKDVSLDRLRHACQWCHLNYDAKEKYRRSLI